MKGGGISSGKSSQDSLHWAFSKRLKNFMIEHKCEPEQLKTASFSCQCTTTLCLKISVAVTNYARRFPREHWSFLGPGSQKKLYGTCNPDGDWDRIVERMMMNFAQKRSSFFRATGALERGELRGKGKGKKSIHFNGIEANIELILRTNIPANQLSVYGAVADLCKELTKA